MEAEQTCSSLDNVMLCKSIGAGLNPLICKISKKQTSTIKMHVIIKGKIFLNIEG